MLFILVYWGAPQSTEGRGVGCPPWGRMIRWVESFSNRLPGCPARRKLAMHHSFPFVGGTFSDEEASATHGLGVCRTRVSNLDYHDTLPPHRCTPSTAHERRSRVAWNRHVFVCFIPTITDWRDARKPSCTRDQGGGENTRGAIGSPQR